MRRRKDKMSLDKFITQVLNIKEDDLGEILPIEQSDGTLVIKLKLRYHPTSCPFCKQKAKIHWYYPRRLVHSTLVNRKCVIIYQQRRYRCEECDITFHEQNPFINTKENLTYETKINVLRDLKWPESTYTSVAKRYGLSKTKVLRIFEQHVNIPRKPLPEILSLDEHYFPESDYESLYCCLLMNFQTGELVDLLPDRKKFYLMHYLSNIKKDTLNHETLKSELDNVKYISIDLFDNFRDLARIYFPAAIVCADSFHVLQHLTKDFRDVRLRCRRNTDNKILAYLLTKFKFVFHRQTQLDNAPRYNKLLRTNVNYRDIRDLLFENFPDLRTAYELKEFYIAFNESSSLENATEKLADVMARFADAGIPEYDEFYTLLMNWSKEIVNSFTVINGVRINNSYIESKNRQLEKILYNANGFTNFKRTRNRILYCLNKADSYTI